MAHPRSSIDQQSAGAPCAARHWTVPVESRQRPTLQRRADAFDIAFQGNWRPGDQEQHQMTPAASAGICPRRPNSASSHDTGTSAVASGLPCPAASSH